MSRGLSRRTLLLGGGIAGLVVAFGGWRAMAPSDPLVGELDPEGAFLNSWIHIGRDDVVTIWAGQSEMGQGAFTGLATLIAEELGCRPDQIRVETGPASGAFLLDAAHLGLADIPSLRDRAAALGGDALEGLSGAFHGGRGTAADPARIAPALAASQNLVVVEDLLVPHLGLASAHGTGDAMLAAVAGTTAPQVTGGSSTLADRFDRARSAGAAARVMLVQAAARRWNVEPSACEARDGAVGNAPSGRSLAFGALVEAAAAEAPPARTPLKPRLAWSWIGTGKLNRVDIPAKVDGSAVYGLDVRRPGMLHAAVMHAPSFGGKLKSFDAAAAKSAPGVVDVIALDDALAVVADSTWRAKAGLARLDAAGVVWSRRVDAADDSSEAISKRLEAALTTTATAESAGDFAAARAAATVRLSADYELPLLAHATMEPMNCTAEVGPDLVEIWAPTQAQSQSLADVARALGVPQSRVRLHTTFLGGGFGRRLETDFVVQAALIAQKIGRPVQTVWSREEDIRHDAYRPPARIRMEGGLDASRRPSAWRMAVASPSLLTKIFTPVTWLRADSWAMQGAVGSPYAIANRSIEYARVDISAPMGSWRSVGHAATAFAGESFVDELAHAAGADPVAFRLDLLAAQPRLAALVRRAAEASGWGEPLPPERGRGMAAHIAFGSAVAEVVDVTVGEAGKLRIDRVVAAVDCGVTVNPDIVRAQIEGGVIFALSAALFGKITIAGGGVVQSNFHDYPVALMAQAPAIEVLLTPSDNPPGGVGEIGVPPLAPALANAIFAATGRRLRSLPIVDHGFSI